MVSSLTKMMMMMMMMMVFMMSKMLMGIVMVTMIRWMTESEQNATQMITEASEEENCPLYL